MANVFVIKTTIKNLDNNARAYVGHYRCNSMSEAREELESMRESAVKIGYEIRLSLPESLVYVTEKGHLVSRSISFERNV